MILKVRQVTNERVIMPQTETRSVYDRARARAERKRRFRGDLVGYVVVNAFLVGVWAVTGFGYFWPGWVIAAWGC